MGLSDYEYVYLNPESLSWILGSSQTSIHYILLSQNWHSLQFAHWGEFRIRSLLPKSAVSKRIYFYYTYFLIMSKDC